MNTPIDLIHNLKPCRILVIGDLILDRYVFGSVDRISPEGPIPVLHASQKQESPGGAANVAGNLAQMGAEVVMAGVIGQDTNGRTLKKLIKQSGSLVHGIFSDKRPTSVKTRFLSQGQQLLRLDEEEIHPLTPQELKLWWKALKGEMQKADLIVLSDYAKGVFSSSLLDLIFSLNQKLKKSILVDPKGIDYTKYKGATLITPNLKECAEASGTDIKNESDLLLGARKILKLTKSSQILVTRGADGMSLISHKAHHHQPTLARSVYDVSGAGDSSLAALSLAWASGFKPEECMHLANLAGGIAVSRLGAHPVSRHDLLHALNDEEKIKIVSFKELSKLRQNYKKQNKKIVLTTGCFDLLHSGHLSLLREAKEQGNILVIGINSDESVRQLKGPTRPIANEEQRAHMLAGFTVVDHVTVFPESSPKKLIETLKPDIWVKGSDYKQSPKDSIFAKELAAVKKHGGTLHLAQFVEGKSTTNLVNKIRQQ